MSHEQDYSDNQQSNVTVTSPGDDDDFRRPPGGAGGAVVVGEDRDEDREWELNPDKPWQTTDFQNRLARAKEQARDMARIKPNYRKAGWSPA